jgi:hypothetical protein
MPYGYGWSACGNPAAKPGHLTTFAELHMRTPSTATCFCAREPRGHSEVVLIDWADCGVAPLGAELNALVGTSSLVFGWPPAQAWELDQIVFASYLDGLAASGWAGDARQVRLGYVGWCALYYGRIFPGFSDSGVGQTIDRSHCSSSAWRKKRCTCSGFHSWTMSWSVSMRRTNSLPHPCYHRGSLGREGAHVKEVSAYQGVKRR